MPIIDPALQRRRLIRLLILAGVVLFLGGGFYALYLINSNKQVALSDEEIIAQAREAFDNNLMDRVVELLEDPRSNRATIPAISEDPELLEMYVTAREVQPLANNRHLTRTIAPLTKIVQLDPQDTESRHKLLDYLLLLDRDDEALQIANQLASQHTDDAVLLRQLAQAQLRAKQQDETLATLQRSTLIDPLHVPTYVEILDLLRDDAQPLEPFIERAQQIYTDHPDDPRAVMIRALAHQAQGNGVQARDLLKQASEQTPPDKALIPLLVRWLDIAGMYAQSSAYLKQHAEQGILTPAGRLAIYRAFESDDYESILARLTDSLPQQANTDLLGMWASAHLQAGNKDQANKLLDELKKRKNAIASTWVKLLQLDMKDSATPAQQIDSIVSFLESNDNPELNALGRRHPFFMQRLGQAYIAALEPEAAYAALTVAINNSQTWAKPHRDLAQALLKLNQPAAAVRHAREAQQRDNSDASTQWLVLAMAAAIDPRDADAVERTLREADKVSSDSPHADQVIPTVIDLLARANHLDEAKQRMTDALASSAEPSANRLESLAQVSQQHSLGFDAQITQLIESRFGMTPRSALIQALTKASAGDIPAGLQSLEQAAPTPPTKPWQTAIAEYLATFQPQDVPAYLAELASQYPDDLALQLSALQANDPATQVEFFTQTIQRLRDLAGESTIHWRLQQARINMLDQQDNAALNDAVALLTKAETFSPVHLQVRLVLAQCQMLLGNYQAAADRAQAAKGIAPRHPQAMLLHGQALQRLQRYQEARLDLLPVASDPAVDPATRLQACLMLYEQGERKVVGETIESMRSAGKANSQALILLAQVYIDRGEFDKTEQICAELLAKPDTQSIRFVSNYYRQTNRPDQAEEALAATQQTGISEADRSMIRAEDAAMRGQTDRAIQLIEQAAQSEPAHANRWKDAVQLALSVSRPSDAIRFAKLATQHIPDEPGITSVLQHDQLIKQIGDDQALIPIAVAILSDHRYRRQAIEALQITQRGGEGEKVARSLASLADKTPNFKHLNELAADRLLSVGLDKQAYDLATTAMARFQDSAATARVATMSAYRLQNWAALLTAANTWAERNPRERMNADLMQAAALNELQRYTVATQLLVPYIQQQKDISESNHLMFELYTCALVRAGNAGQAWERLRPHLQSSASAKSIALKRITEDLTQVQTIESWMDEVAANSPDDTTDLLALATASFLAGQRVSDSSLIERADQLVSSVLLKPGPHSIDVYYAHAQIAQHLGQLDRAEASYQKVLQSLPDNPLVLNNLALILAERGGSSLVQAQQFAERATTLSPQDPNLFDTLATVHLRRGQFDQAIVAIDTAIQLDPNTPAWHLTKAKILDAMGQTDNAEQIRQRYQPRV